MRFPGLPEPDKPWTPTPALQSDVPLVLKMPFVCVTLRPLVGSGMVLKGREPIVGFFTTLVTIRLSGKLRGKKSTLKFLSIKFIFSYS